MISSVQNAQIKALQKRKKSSKIRNEDRLFLVEGIKMVTEAFRYSAVEQLYVSETFAQQQELSFDAPTEILSDRVFSQVSDTVTPQGILAVVKMPEHSLFSLLKKECVRLVLLENLQDPGNMGTIIRTAEGAGMDGVILGEGCADLFSPKVVRATMGALFRVPCVSVASFQEMLGTLQKSGIRVIATDLSANRQYREIDYTGRCAIVVGNEAKGITPETRKRADQTVRIPMEGSVESLNASVAAALMMYEAYWANRRL